MSNQTWQPMESDQRLLDENKRLREALEFYANKENYYGISSKLGNGVITVWPINGDNGSKARAALKPSEGIL